MAQELLHEHWREYTPKEIRKTIVNKCVNCKYSKIGQDAGKHKSSVTCDYILITGTPRKCRPEVCDKFVSRKSK